jgi:hypothetical protein
VLASKRTRRRNRLTGTHCWHKLRILMVSHPSDHVRLQQRWGLAVVLALAVLGGGCGSSSAAGDSQSRDSAAGDSQSLASAVEVGDSATASGKPDMGPTCPPPEKTPSFAQDVVPFLDAQCNVCHSTHPRDGGFAPSAQNFETYASFKTWAEESLISMRQGTMPPPESDPATPAADICMYQAWINQGAEDN